MLGEVVQRGVVAGPDRVLDGLLVRRPRRGRLQSPARRALTSWCFERRVQHGDRLRDAERHVVEGDVLAFILGRVQPQLFTPFSVGVRLGVQELRTTVGGFVRPSSVSKLGRVLPPVAVLERRVARVDEVLEQRLHVLVVDQSAQAQRFGAGRRTSARAAPPRPRRRCSSSPALGDLAGQVRHRVPRLMLSTPTTPSKINNCPIDFKINSAVCVLPACGGPSDRDAWVRCVLVLGVC